MKNPNEKVLHDFLDKVYNLLNINPNIGSKQFKKCFEGENIYQVKILSTNSVLKIITKPVSEDDVKELIRNEDYQLFKNIVLLIVPDIQNGKKLNVQTILKRFDKKQIEKSLKKENSKNLKTDLKILQQKKFSNVVLQISKIKIIKNNDKMDAIVNKISKDISGYSGVKLKPIDVEINV